MGSEPGKFSSLAFNLYAGQGGVNACERGVSFIRVQIINDVKCLCLLPKDLKFFPVTSLEPHSMYFFPFHLTPSTERRKD